MGDKPTEYEDVAKAATAILDAYSAFTPPAFLEVRVKRQPGQIVTSGALQHAIRAAARERYPKLRVDGALVGLKWPDEHGATFTVEGLWKVP